MCFWLWLVGWAADCVLMLSDVMFCVAVLRKFDVRHLGAG